MSLLRGVTILRTTWRLGAAGLGLLALAGTAGASDPAAPPPEPPGETTPRPADAAADARAQAHADFKRLFDAGEFAAAAERARTVVELTEREHGAQPEELQVTLMNLALAEQYAGDYVEAEATYQRVIKLIEASGRLGSARLARAYAGLATTYHAARRHDLAAASFERAIALNRRAEGLFNPGQLPLLEKQADSLTELGRIEDALLARRYALRVVSQRSGESSLPYAREIESLGRWYTRVGYFEAGRATLRRAAELVASLAGPASPELVGPLTAFAENARRWLMDPRLRDTMTADEERSIALHDPAMPTPPSLSTNTIAAEGQKALERAASILGARPDSSPALVAGVRAQLGDWHQARGQPDKALPQYRLAWQAAGAAPDGSASRRTLFGAPVLLQYVAPDGWDAYARRPADEVERHDVEIELTVTAQGGVREPRAVSGSGDPRLVSKALRAVATGRYRPRFAEGEPVETTGVRFVQPFFELRAEAPADAPAAAPTEVPTKPPPEAPPAAPPITAPPAQGGG